MVQKHHQTNLKSERIFLNKRELPSRGLENVFCQVHTLLFSCLTDDIQHIFSSMCIVFDKSPFWLLSVV